MSETQAPSQRKSLVLDVNAVLRAADNASVRKSGRSLVFALHGALRAVKLYPLENAAVQKALADVTAQARELLSIEDTLEIRLSGEIIFVNATRLRLDLENFASFSHLLSLFRTCGVGCIHVRSDVQQKDWMIFLSQLQAPGPENPADRFDDLVQRLQTAGVSAITVEMPVEQEDANRGGSKEKAKRTYAQCVTVTKDLMTGVRLGQSPNIKKIKRVVQTIVDQILNDESSLIGLTAILDYDEYTFTHSVNVCIFSVALGKRLGLSKLQLYDLDRWTDPPEVYARRSLERAIFRDHGFAQVTTDEKFTVDVEVVAFEEQRTPPAGRVSLRYTIRNEERVLVADVATAVRSARSAKRADVVVAIGHALDAAANDIANRLDELVAHPVQPDSPDDVPRHRLSRRR